MEVIAARTMNALYMYLDVAFLLFLGATLVYTKRYLAILVGLLAGILYFIVDYGYFYLYLGTRRELTTMVMKLGLRIPVISSTNSHANCTRIPMARIHGMLIFRVSSVVLIL